MDSALFEYENCFLNLFMSSLHLLRHIFWKKHATFYNISLSSLRTIEVSPSKRRRKQKKATSDYLNLGHVHVHTHTKEDTNPTIKTASSQEWLACSQDERLRASLLLLHIRDDSFYYEKVNKDSTSQVICSLYIQPIYPWRGGGESA